MLTTLLLRFGIKTAKYQHLSTMKKCERANIYCLFYFSILTYNAIYFILLITCTFFKSGINAIDILIFMLGTLIKDGGPN